MTSCLLTLNDLGMLTANGEGILPNRHYDLDGEHRYIVRRISEDLFWVQVKKGKKIVQESRVQLCSFAAGSHLDGRAMLRGYTLELSPHTTPWPIEPVVKSLLDNNYLAAWMISPMTTTLHETVGSWKSAPMMLSDGTLQRWGRPESEDSLENISFSVTEATWAILVNPKKNRVMHVYLWPGAEKYHSTVLQVIEAIQEGTDLPEGVKSAT